MKVKIVSLAIIALCLITVSEASAQNLTDTSNTDEFCPRFYVAPEVLGFFPSKSSVKDSTFVGGRAGLDITEHIAAELESGWVGLDVRGALGKEGTLDNVPLLANARYNIMGTSSPWDIFVMGGLGVAFNWLSVDDSSVLSGHAKDGTFAAQAGGGAEYRFTQDMSLTVDVRYYWNDPRARVTAGPAESGVISDINADSFVAGGSFIYKF